MVQTLTFLFNYCLEFSYGKFFFSFINQILTFFLTFFLNIAHRFSIGFKPGKLEGQSITQILWASKRCHVTWDVNWRVVLLKMPSMTYFGNVSPIENKCTEYVRIYLYLIQNKFLD